MSSAAQVTIERSRARLSPRSAARLRRYTLRGAAIVYLGAIVVLPVVAVATRGFGDGLGSLRTALAVPGATAAIRLTLITSTLASVISAVMGTMLAYALVRYPFPGRRILSAVVDLPLAIPTLVTGVMLVALYGPSSPIGEALERIGIRVIFTPIAILFALLVVTLPLVVRSVQPVLQELDNAEEEAAATLGANGWTTFRKVVLPAIRPAIIGGTLLTFARCLGEFGSVVLVAGNRAGETLTAPVFIFQLTTQFRPLEAAAVATLLFSISFVLVLVTARLLKRKEDDA
ncbi:MAG TPA: sulfate ABC transporter permease subunit CysT [Actinomycetota bacterium]|nr:sulfate ABC transporter permease subunit CysT [Actinomycetota bacterium]